MLVERLQELTDKDERFLAYRQSIEQKHRCVTANIFLYTEAAEIAV